MKRSGFKRPERPEKPAKVLIPIRQLIPHQAATLPFETPKYPYVRSRKLLDACGTIPCQSCGIDDGTIVGAHSNWGWGRGGHIKSDDNRVAAMCTREHGMLDQGSEWSEAEKKTIWWKAHVKTVQILVILKRWPHEVTIPSLEYPESWE